MTNGSTLEPADVTPFSFHLGTSETILFKAWTISSIGGLIGSCLAVFLLALVAEGVVVTMRRLQQRFATDIRHRMVEAGSTESTRLVEEQAEGQIPMLSWMHLLLSAIYVVRVFLFYTLMLVVMTGNVCIFLAVVLGATLGYFLFSGRDSICFNLISVKK
ncbi:high affinity copper uptake protein 1-like [Diadema antillarum]|uniref:high affinity copper uptake protein 1-like n=1 Tax=Diadema antillarum TaxID=105358 RepID=UPI003A89E4E1